MKQGKTLDELVAEVGRIEASKRDLVVDSRHLMMTSTETATPFEGPPRPVARRDKTSVLTIVGVDDEFAVNEYAHGQIAEFAKVPLPFYRRLRASYPDVLDTTVNRILHQEPKRRMIRTIDGTTRAFLSDRYRRRDNYDLLAHIVPTLRETLGGGDTLRTALASCELTETKLYLTVVFPFFQDEIRVGDPVKIGVRISNSEVGAGRTSVATILWRLICKNGMTTGHELAANHVGRRVAADEDFSVYSDETLELDDKAFFAKVGDSVRAATTEARFRSIVSEMRELAETKVDADPIEAVELLGNKVGLTEDETKSVLGHLIDGGDRTAWGYVNAVTRMAQDVPSYDRSMEIERIGGRLASGGIRELVSVR